MIRASDAKRDKIYRRTKKSRVLVYYMVPRIGRDAYERKLRKKYTNRSILCGQESTNLRNLTKNPDAVLLRRVIRYRVEGERRYRELPHLVVVCPKSKLRAVKRKPTR